MKTERTTAHDTAAALLDEPVQSEDLSFLSTEEWQLTRRIVANNLFAKSELLQRFLLHVCELALRDRTQEITEQRIGAQIFNRRPDYNPGEDNIVRSYARMLRKRLEQYFAEEGHEEPLRIVIPRGGYVPVFEAAQLPPTEELPEPLPTEQTTATQPPSELGASAPLLATEPTAIVPSRSSPWSLPGFSLLAAFALGALIASVIFIRLRPTPAAKEQSAAHALWEQVFQPNHNTLIVPADSGIGILENLSGQLVNVEEYANHTYLSAMKSPRGMDEGSFNDLSRQRYTSVVDVYITARLVRLPEYLPSRTQIRYARSITAEDLKNTNVILLGSKHANPWDELFEKRLNFRLEYAPTVDQSWVTNENPREGEQKIYRNGSTSPNYTYGTVSYLPAPDGNGQILILQGLNMAATQAAAETLFNPQAIRPILKQATLPTGLLRPFELLIETSSVGATNPEARIIATRFY